MAKNQNSLIAKLKKTSKISHSDVLTDSDAFNVRDVITTDIPMINVALSADLFGGFTAGVIQLAGPSKHFKSGFALLFAAAYMKKYPDAALLFYDSEFGTPLKYFKTFNIDTSRVLHTPVTDLEELKQDLVAQLDGLTKEDKVIIIVDSIGNLASIKEVQDALDQNVVADFTRAKSIKSTFRMITAKLNLKDIPLIAVNHTYKEIGTMAKSDIVGGGTGSYLASDTIWILGRQQDKEGKDVIGYDFIINIDKSRHVKEKSKIPISISWENGIDRYSGLIELALEHGKFVTCPSKGWYQTIDPTTGELSKNLRLGDINNADFWEPILLDRDFREFIRKKYEVGYKDIMGASEEEVQEG